MSKKVLLLFLLLMMIFSLENIISKNSEIKWAGFRSSIYGATDPDSTEVPVFPFPEPEDWQKGLKAITLNFNPSETEPTLVWIVGKVDDTDPNNGQLLLEMNRSSAEYDDIHFIDDKDANFFRGYTNHEKWLDYFDKNGTKVLLQVEPGHSDVNDIIDAVMGKWGNHECVIGFGVDIEWYMNSSGSGGGEAMVSTPVILEWLDAIHKYNNNAKLMVKHWDPVNMANGTVKDIPVEKRDSIIFCCDSQGAGSVKKFVKTMKYFAKAYNDRTKSCDIWFQIGYATEWWETPPWAPKNLPWFHKIKKEWKPGKDGIPAKERGYIPQYLGKKLAKVVNQSQDIGIIWVDFTMRNLYPEIFPDVIE